MINFYSFLVRWKIQIIIIKTENFSTCKTVKTSTKTTQKASVILSHLVSRWLTAIRDPFRYSTKVIRHDLPKMKANRRENSILLNFLSLLHSVHRSISTMTTKGESISAILLSNNLFSKISLRPIQNNVWPSTHSRIDQALIAHRRAASWGIQRRTKFLEISELRWRKKSSPRKSSFLKLFKIAQPSQSNRLTRAATCQALTRTLLNHLRTMELMPLASISVSELQHLTLLKVSFKVGATNPSTLTLSPLSQPRQWAINTTIQWCMIPTSPLSPMPTLRWAMTCKRPWTTPNHSQTRGTLGEQPVRTGLRLASVDLERIVHMSILLNPK